LSLAFQEIEELGLKMKMKLKALTLATVLSLYAGCLQAQDFVNSELPWHAVAIDKQGKLLAWYAPEKSLGYDKVVRLAWDYMEHKAATDPKTGLKVYLINSVFDSKTGLGNYRQNNPASTFGQFVDSMVTWYPYAGDNETSGVVRSMLDYQLAHGTSPANWEWASVPFATGCGNDVDYGKCMQDAPRGFYGGIETDKLGELGIGYVLFYEFTGERKYLTAGIKCADALAKHVHAGDEMHTPWPFRVDAQTGQAFAGSEYGGMVVAPVRLFAELIRLKEGNVTQYENSRRLAWNWILKYPVHNNRWLSYFEDVPQSEQWSNQALPTMTAYYILSQKDPATVDKHWISDVGHMIDWVKKHYGRGPYFGAWAIDEQGRPPDDAGCCSRAGLASDTSRWGAINALFYERTKDGQAREDAFRSLNYATYFAADDGKIACCGLDYADSYWWDDGYGDYIRNFLWAMGAVPEFAPKGEDHLLRSTSVVRSVEYGKHTLRYTTFDAEGSEILRLSYAPTRIEADGVALAAGPDPKEQGYILTPLSDGDYVVRIRHLTSRNVRISG
jgi:hypothetical protein